MTFPGIEEYKYKIETHCHSKPVSGCADFEAESVVEKYKAIGFDGIVLTNHLISSDLSRENKEEAVKWYLSDYYKAKAKGDEIGLKVYLGMEIRFANVNINDYLVYGITEEDIYKAVDYLEGDLETFYKGFKNDKNVIFQAHPHRAGCQPEGPEFLDGYEAFNMHQSHNQSNGFSIEFAKKTPGFLMCGGSDFHHEGHQGTIGMVTKYLPETSIEVADILKKQDFLLNYKGSIIIP